MQEKRKKEPNQILIIINDEFFSTKKKTEFSQLSYQGFSLRMQSKREKIKHLYR